MIPLIMSACLPVSLFACLFSLLSFSRPVAWDDAAAGNDAGPDRLKMVRGDGRVTYTRRHAYHTLSNKAKVVKTPGGKLVAHYHKKSAKGPRCGDCGISLPGVRAKQSCSCGKDTKYWALVRLRSGCARGDAD